MGVTKGMTLNKRYKTKETIKILIENSPKEDT
jgi:hypothetical protein